MREYNAAITLMKSLMVVLPAVGLGTAVPYVGAVLGHFPEDAASFEAAWPVIVGGLGAGIFRAVGNYWKNRAKAKNGIIFDLRGGSPLALLLASGVAAGAVFTGCGTTGGFLERVETVTMTYPDGTVEVVESREFDTEAWNNIVAHGATLQALAERHARLQAELDAREHEMEEAERERKREEMRALAETLANAADRWRESVNPPADE